MQRILIIGGTSAIAQAIAHRLAPSATAMMLWGRSESKLKVVAQDLQVRHALTPHTKAFDFNDVALHETVFHEAVGLLGGLDLAVICYGSLGNQQASQEDFRTALRELNTNCISALSFLTLIGNYFEKRKHGCIVAVSSVAGDRGRQSNYVYGTAKAALTTFLEGLRNRLYQHGITVTTVKPGFVDTPMTAGVRKNFLFASSDRVARDVVRGISRKRAVVYTPWFWRYIMMVIKIIPERYFQRLKL